MARKTHFIHVRITPDEEQIIQRKADKMGLSIGQFMRFISIKAEIEVSKVNVSQK